MLTLHYAMRAVCMKVNVSSLDFSDHLFLGILVGISYSCWHFLFHNANNVLIVTEVVQYYSSCTT